VENYIFTCGKCEKKYSFVGYKTGLGKSKAQLEEMAGDEHVCRECGHDDRKGGPKNSCDLDWGDNPSTASAEHVAGIIGEMLGRGK